MEKWFNDEGYFVGQFPGECVSDCSHSHGCAIDVIYWQKELNFEVPRVLTVNYLREFGGWEIEELEAMSDIRLAQIVLWSACCELKENGEWFGLVH